MMIFVTGDIHGDLSVNRLSSKNWPRGRELCRDDYVVILGDFGLIWDQCESRNEKYWLDWLENKPWTTLVIDGNHENFDRINSGEFPIYEWHGGLVQEFRPHVLHLMRGEIFDLDGISVLAFGGANSTDREYRTEGISWWAEERPSIEERGHCVDNLIAHGDKVDVVFTHEGPEAAWYTTLAGIDYGPDEISRWIQANIANVVEFKRWYFGHHHVDRIIPPDHRCLYYDIVRLGELEDVEA